MRMAGTCTTLGPNKPMVPTAPTSLTHYSPDSLRRIGQPLDREATRSERRVLGFGAW
jgi:hypothetical protein